MIFGKLMVFYYYTASIAVQSTSLHFEREIILGTFLPVHIKPSPVYPVEH